MDIRVREHYLPVLKHLFMGVKDPQNAIRFVYGMEFFQKASGGLPHLRDYYKVFLLIFLSHIRIFIQLFQNFDDELLNALSDAEQGMEMDVCNRRLGFLFMISPRPAIRQVLLYCFKRKEAIPVILKVCNIEGVYSLQYFLDSRTSAGFF